MYTLIKHLDATLISAYLQARKDDDAPPPTPLQPKLYIPIDARPILRSLSSIASLAPDHPARLYIEGRLIPPKFHNQLYWTDDFAALGAQVQPGKYEHLRREGRIVIPLLDQDHLLLGIQGRSLDPDAQSRYITLKTFDDAPKIYGLHRLKKDCKHIYIVEGAFDFIFLPDSVAMSGSDIPTCIPKEKVIVVYDNEPKHTGTCKKMERAIEQGYRVFFWPYQVREKDINQMVLAGKTPETILEWIREGSFTNTEATKKLRDWRLDWHARYSGIDPTQPTSPIAP
jgi:hypothetical protein